MDGAETVSTTVSFPEALAEKPDTDQYGTGGDTGDLPSGTGEVEIELLPDTRGPNPLALATASAVASLALIAAGMAAVALRAARRKLDHGQQEEAGETGGPIAAYPARLSG